MRTVLMLLIVHSVFMGSPSVHAESADGAACIGVDRRGWMTFRFMDLTHASESWTRLYDRSPLTERAKRKSLALGESIEFACRNQRRDPCNGPICSSDPVLTPTVCTFSIKLPLTEEEATAELRRVGGFLLFRMEMTGSLTEEFSRFFPSENGRMRTELQMLGDVRLSVAGSTGGSSVLQIRVPEDYLNDHDRYWFCDLY